MIASKNLLKRSIFTITLILLCIPVFSAAGQSVSLDTDALMHDSRDTLYRTPTGAVPLGTDITLRFRTAAGNVDAVNIRGFDMTQQTQFITPMQVITTTPGGYDIWETTLNSGDALTIISYNFAIQSGGETVIYEDDAIDRNGALVEYLKGGVGTAAANGSMDYQIAVYDPEFYTPEWFRNGIIYQIFPDRFRDGDPSNNPEDGAETFYGNIPLYFHETWNEPMLDGRVDLLPDGSGYWNSDFYGGDLAGITEKLDYLQSLGVTGIYLNPIFEARSNHRYDTADFLRIDPYLGTQEDFETLITEAADRDMHIILDGVFNHLSSDSRFFDRYGRFEDVGACESVDSEFRSWFYFRDPRGEESAMCDGENGQLFYESWFGFDSIPKVNNATFATRAYFIRGPESVARTWGTADIGGWRLDVGGDIDNGRDPDNNYWEIFRDIVRLVDNEDVIIGEEWGDGTPWLLGDEWDTVMNYRFRRGIIGMVRGTNFTDNDGIIRGLTPEEFDQVVSSVEEDYPPMAYHAMMNLLDSHDTTRTLFALENDLDAMRLAALTQYTLPGAPTTYYGNEIAINAPSRLDGNILQDDPYNRAPYPWPDTTGDHYPAPNYGMLTYYQTLGEMRHANPALREGEMATLIADTSTYAFARTDAETGNVALVVMNTSDDARTVNIDFTHVLPTGMTLQSVFTGETLTTDSGVASLELAGISGDVWVGQTEAFVTLPAPENVTADGGADLVTVSWDAVEDAAGYVVYRSPVAIGGFEPISDVVAETSFDDTTITNGFVYHYAVAAVSASNLLGEMSASASGVPFDLIDSVEFVAGFGDDETIMLAYNAEVEIQVAITIADVTGQGEVIPGILAQAALVSESNDPTWQAMNFLNSDGDADVYSATLSPSASGEFAKVARFSTNAGETWTEVMLEDERLPILTVEAPEDTQAPEAPSDFAIARASISGVDLVWVGTEADDLAAYRIYRTDQDESTILVAELAADVTAYADQSVVQGNSYVYAITAVDNALNESEQFALDRVTVNQVLLPVTFVVNIPENTTPTDTLYLAGDFGTDALPFWDPAGIALSPFGDGQWATTIEFPEGASIDYKFTRGSWDVVEKGSECEEIPNRQLSINLAELGEPAEDGTYQVIHDVAKWRDLDNCP